MRQTRTLVTGSTLAAAALLAADAAAVPPADVSVAVERLFGFTRTTIDYGEGSDSFSSVSVFGKVIGAEAYSPARLGVDFLASSGLSFGGALGFQSVEGTDGWLLAPRIGYFARPSSSFGLWPRGGLTFVGLERGSSAESTATALTVEVPLEFLVGRGGAAISLTPFADIGIGGHDGDTDRTITELGLQFGMGLFF